MKSKNFSLALWIGYYLVWLVVYRRFGEALLGTEAAFLGASALVLPLLLVCRGRFAAAVTLLSITGIFGSTLLFMQLGRLSYPAMLQLYNHPPIAVFALLGLVLPGLFLLTELDAESLPHELGRWGHLGLFQPLIVVITARERARIRLAAIEEVCGARGIGLTTNFQHLRRPFLWLVPLANAMISEAAYAGRYRTMLDCGHHFVPTRGKRPILTTLQLLSSGGLALFLLLGIALAVMP